MPEGPEVRTITRYLNINLSGKTLVDYNNMLHHVTCYGKCILFVFDSYVMVSRLGMEGKWLLGSNINNHTRLLLEFTDGTMVHYDDGRKLGSISFTTSIPMSLSSIGPDLLWYAIKLYGIDDGLIPPINIPDITLSYYTSVIHKHPRLPICKFLLDQNKFSGVGNYLKSEILYMSQIHPTRILGTLSDSEIQSLYWSTLYIMVKSYIMDGFTLKSYINPYGLKGGYKPMIYGRQFDDNGNKIHRGIFQDKRVSYYI
jgi:formamidopyrimidine-DNA glycosylase